jgi:uncharacterized MAPEG superfamily protein
MAHIAGVPASTVVWLALAFVVFRVLHGVVYIMGLKHSLRSLVWFGGFACSMGLIALAALRVGHAVAAA